MTALATANASSQIKTTVTALTAPQEMVALAALREMVVLVVPAAWAAATEAPARPSFTRTAEARRLVFVD